MSIEEMQKEVERDLDAVYARMCYFNKDNRRFFIKSTRFPVYKTFKWKSHITKSEWNIIMMARSKKEVTCPAIVPYVKYQSYGTGIVYMRPVNGVALTTIYTPHLLSRYRERCLGDIGISFSTDEVITHLFVNSSIPTYDFALAKDQFLIHIDQGVIFGDYNSDRTRLLAKTFVSKDMLFEEQAKGDKYAMEMRDMIAKSKEYQNNNHLPFGIDRYTGEICESLLA